MRARHGGMTVAMMLALLLMGGCGGASDTGASAAPPHSTTISGARTEVPGDSAPGAARTDATPPLAATVARPAQDGSTMVFSEQTYGFRVTHPAPFTVATQPAAQREALVPQPAAVFTFMNPVAAASDVPEPADLEIRAYAPGATSTLDEWLASSGLLPSDGSAPKPFGNGQVSGVEICGGTMIAPGCAYFVRGERWVYQMIPATLAGEAIRDSFALHP